MLKKLCAVAVLSLVFFPTIFSMERDEESDVGSSHSNQISRYSNQTSQEIVNSHNNRQELNSNQLVSIPIFDPNSLGTADRTSEVDTSGGTSDTSLVDKGKQKEEEDLEKGSENDGESTDDLEAYVMKTRFRDEPEPIMPEHEGESVGFVRPHVLRPKSLGEKVVSKENITLACGVCLGTACACVHGMGWIDFSIVRWGYLVSGALIARGGYRTYKHCKEQVWQSDVNYITGLEKDLKNPRLMYFASKYFNIEIPEGKVWVKLYLLTCILKLMVNGTLVTSVPAGDDKVTLYTDPHRVGVKIVDFATLVKFIDDCEELNCAATSDLGFTSERNIPSALLIFRNLQKVKISGVSYIKPAAIFNLPNLTHLEISDCPLAAMGEVVKGLKNCLQLQQVILPNNQLNSTQMSRCLFSNLPRMIRLDLSNNLLESIPQEITNLTSLTSLDLTQNNLGSISPILTRLQNMQTFTVSGNNRLRRNDIPDGIRGAIEF